MRVFVLYSLFFVILPLFSQNTGKIQLVGSVESPDIRGLGITYCANPFKDSEFNRTSYKDIFRKGDVYVEEIERATFQVALLSIPGSRMMPVFMTPGDSVSFIVKETKTADLFLSFPVKMLLIIIILFKRKEQYETGLNYTKKVMTSYSTNWLLKNIEMTN